MNNHPESPPPKDHPPGGVRADSTGGLAGPQPRPLRPPSGKLIAPAFFERDTLEVARQLCGKLLVREVDGEVLYGRLVEVEAYLGPDDLAAHSSGGRRTPRNEVMFGPPGHAYVYFTYGMHHCLNFVTEREGVPQAVLARALEPGPGVGRCSGPGLLCRSLAIYRSDNGAPLQPPGMYLLDDGFQTAEVFATPWIVVE